MIKIISLDLSQRIFFFENLFGSCSAVLLDHSLTSLKEIVAALTVSRINWEARRADGSEPFSFRVPKITACLLSHFKANRKTSSNHNFKASASADSA